MRACRTYFDQGVDRSLPPSEVLGRVEPKIPVSSEHDQCGPESEELDSRPGPHFSFHSPFPSNLNVKLEPFSTLSVQRWRLERQSRHRTLGTKAHLASSRPCI